MRSPSTSSSPSSGLQCVVTLRLFYVSYHTVLYFINHHIALQVGDDQLRHQSLHLLPDERQVGLTKSV